MNTMKNQNGQKRSNEKKEIPKMSDSEISSLWSSRAQDLGGIQLYRPDGTPIIGAILNNTPASSKGARAKRRNNCVLDCCIESRPLVSSAVGFAPRISQFPDTSTLEPEFTDWQKVEPRSVRRLKTRARYQTGVETNYTRPSVLYAMED
jgi:hypothetical protein